MASVKVPVSDIKVSFPVVQGKVNSMRFPDLGGNSLADLNAKLADGKDCILGAVFRSITDPERSVDAPCKVKNFSGTISLVEPWTLTIEGEGIFDAHPIAYSLIEDEGSAEVWFCDVVIDGVELQQDTEEKSKWVKLTVVSK